MKWHPIIAGLYRYQFDQATVGNGVDAGNVIMKAMERAIDLRCEPHYADVWERKAVREAILAAHAAHQLGLV